METTTPRAGALATALLGALVLLVAGAVVLSTLTAPPVDREQLRAAALATLAAPGFVIDDTNSVAPLQPSARRRARSELVRVVYQAPDRVQETGVGSDGRLVSVIVGGGAEYRTLGGRWVALAPDAAMGARAVATVLAPLRAAAGAAGVRRRGDVDEFVPADVDAYVATVLGMNSASLASLRFTARIGGDHVTDERISAVFRGQRLTVDLAFGSVGTAPPVRAPSPSTPVPGP